MTGERDSSAIEERCAKCGDRFGYNVCFVIGDKQYCHQCWPAPAKEGDQE